MALFFGDAGGGIETMGFFLGFRTLGEDAFWKEKLLAEIRALKQKGLEDVLLLTGESYQVTPTSYLLEAVGIAREFFPSISLL